MYPTIRLSALGLELPTYGLCALVGTLTAIVVIFIIRRRTILTEDNILDGVIFTVVFSMLGAKILYLITEPPALPLTWAAVKELITTGLVFYGGLIGAFFGLWIAARKTKKPYLTFTDTILPGFCFAHAFGRVGCLMAGCCYGVEREGFFCVQLAGVSRLAVQLMEAIFLVLLGVSLCLIHRKKPRRGTITGLYMVLYAVWRFVIEFWRDDDDRGYVGALSTSQFISIFVFAAGVLLLYLSIKRCWPRDFRDGTEPPLQKETVPDMPALIAVLESMPPEERAEALREKAKTLLPALEKRTGSPEKARELYCTFVLGALLADGRLADEEYPLIKPMLQSFLGEETDIDTCRARLSAAAEKTELLKENADLLIDALGESDPALRNDCVLTSLILCSVDGKVSAEEQAYIAQLL